MTPHDTPVLDTHLHLWDLYVSDYAWLGPEHGDLHRSHTPAEIAPWLGKTGVSGAVLVQAEDSLADTDWLLGLATECSWVHGVVGWVPLEDRDEAGRQLDRLAGSRLLGIRHLVHDDPRADFLELPQVRSGLGLLAERGIPFDVPDAWPAHLDMVADLADALPELVIVVDHLAKPPHETQEWQRWRESLTAVAARPNTVAKVSGLQSPGRAFTAEALRPSFDVALDAFGAERLMFGSDWPMTTNVGYYDDVLSVYAALFDPLTKAERRALWAQTGTRIYGSEDDE